jgi:hypothetical protein
MDIMEFLRYRGVDLPAIVAYTQAKVGLEPTDVLLAVGSLAEGLGNNKSDLDLLLITPRDASDFPSHEVPLVVGRCLSDVQVLPLLKLHELLARFARWNLLSWDVTQATTFTLEERRLLHRLLHAVVIFQDPGNPVPTELPTRLDVARLKLQVARHMSRTVQIDIVGNREAGDYASMLFSAQELLGHAVDALTAGHHFTNPTPKWRSRILEALPSDWEQQLAVRPTGLSAAQLVWKLHRAPERPDRSLVLAHSFRIGAFARATFAWAERQLRSERVETKERVAWPSVGREVHDTTLPYLDLDVDYSIEDGRVSLGRLNEFDDPIEISIEEFLALLLFDGVTTEREAELFICGSFHVDPEQRLVGRLVSRLARAGISVSL